MIAKKSTLVVLQNLLGMVFGFIALKLVALNLGPDAYGQMVIGFAVVSLFSFIAGLGFGNAHLKRISEGKDLGTCIGTFAAIRILTTAIMVVAVLASLAVWTYFNPNGLTDVSTGVILAVLIYFIFTGIASIPITTFDARAETSKSQITNMLQHPVKMVAVIFVIWSVGGVAGGLPQSEIAYRLTWAYYTVGSMVTCLIAWAMLFFYKYPIKRPTWAMVRSYSGFAALTSISSVLGVVMINADRVMLGFFWNDTVVGEYFGVQSLTNMLQIIPAAVALLLLPVLSHLDSKRDTKTIGTLLTLSERHISMIVAPITFFIFFFSRPIIHLMLADKWLPADFTLSFLAIVTFITAQNSIRNTLLQAIGRPGLTMSIGVVITTFYLVLNFLFIPNWSWFQPSVTIPGIITPSGQTHVIPITSHAGAAMAMILANLVGFFLLRYYSWKCIRTGAYHGVTVKHVFASIIMVLPLIYLNRVHELARWYDLLLYIGIGLGIYIGVLYLVKEFNKKDLQFYIELVNPTGMKKYIADELKEKDLSVALDTIDGSKRKPGKPGRVRKTDRAGRRRYEEE